MRWRIYQLVRLAAEHFDHVIFSAWGCGDFSLPARDVAYLFRHALRGTSFTSITFAIKSTSYSDTYSVFKSIMEPENAPGKGRGN